MTTSNVEKTIEMARRVGLSRRFAMKVFYIALRSGLNSSNAVNMVLIAQAISYAGKNKHLLKEEWRLP